MGVIDLNARVTALEKNAGNSQEIDQIEADLTALEGTVEALETPEKTAVTEIATGLTISESAGGVYYEVLGKLVHVHLAAEGFTSNTRTTAFTIPSAVRPDTAIFASGYAGPGTGSNKYPSFMIITTDGNVDIITPTASSFIDAVYVLPAPTPTP